jgi:hypothetical protein
MPSGETELSNDQRPPVLFLRSFDDDKLAPNLGDVLQPDGEALSGPDIALGNPDDYLPAPGAARIYCDHDKWRDEFVALAAKAQIVIVLEGVTEGLAWELSHIRQSIAPEKTFVITRGYVRRSKQLAFTHSTLSKMPKFFCATLQESVSITRPT